MIPQLVKLQDELKDSGFVVVATHVQNGSKDEVSQILRKNRVNYTVTSSGSVPGEKVDGIPHAFLFDSSGKLVDKGHPSGMKKKIHDLVQSEPHFLAAGRKYTKLAPVAESLKKTKAYGPILKKLEKDAKGNGPVAEEASYLSERIKAFGKKKIDAAKALEGDDPFLAQEAYVEIVRDFKGGETESQAAARLKELKADAEFQKELKASTILHQLLAECEKMVSQGGTYNHDNPGNRKIVATVKSGCTALKKKFPDSKAASKAAGELAPFGFKDV